MSYLHKCKGLCKCLAYRLSLGPVKTEFVFLCLQHIYQFFDSQLSRGFRTSFFMVKASNISDHHIIVDNLKWSLGLPSRVKEVWPVDY